MGTMTASGMNVVGFLKSQHQDVKALLNQILASEPSQRAQGFALLKNMLTVHEAAEEEIVHPVAERVLPNGHAIVAAREKEEQQANEMIAKLSQLDATSNEFITKLKEFQSAVLKHAEAEETQEFDKLGAALDQSQLVKMKQQVIESEETAGGHPQTGIVPPMKHI